MVVPENPTKKLYGTLKFIRNERAVLDLIGDFKDYNNPLLGIVDFFKESQRREEIIHGLSVDGKSITLYRCDKISGNISLKGIPCQIFKIDIILVGHHFKTPEDIKFKQISIHYSHLNEWVNISGFKVLFHDDKFMDPTIKYKKPENIYLIQNEDYEIFINFDSIHLYPFFGKDLSIKQRSYISINALNENMNFRKSNEFIEQIQDFLTFGIMETVDPLIISGIIESDFNSNNEPISIFLSYLKINDSIEISSTRDMLFSFEDVRENISFYLTNWLENAKKINYIYGLYFSTLRSPTYIQNSFLNYIMAIEGYHRAMENNLDLPEEEHKQRINEILNAVGKASQENRNWLSGRLKHSNEPGLKKRLNIILENYHEIFDGEEKFKEFVNFVYDTRNILVHPEGNENLTINMITLYNNTELLKLVVSICLLNVLGFETDDIGKLILKMKTKLYKAT